MATFVAPMFEVAVARDLFKAGALRVALREGARKEDMLDLKYGVGKEGGKEEKKRSET